VLLLGPARGEAVVINEIFYHPAGTNLLEQWFELFNPAPGPVDVSGWRVTRGVEFQFPSGTVIPGGGYLVVAADAATFAAHNPGVANVVAGWTGTLHHAIEVSDAAGSVVNAVEFYDQGDWATRVLGANGVLGATDDFKGLGWSWFALHDGGGASLELINPELPNTYAHNWGANATTNTTPGRANSLLTANTAPLIASVSHLPIIPQPADPVVITARIVDEHPATVVATVFWRVDGSSAFTPAAMADDGAHGDGVASDGVFGAILPPQPAGTIVEFYLQAADDLAQTRVHPRWIAPADSSRTANLLYQVDSGTSSSSQPVYRMILRESERTYLEALSNNTNPANGPTTDSDADMNATWITTDAVVSDGTTTQLRYNVGVRNRGHGSRASRPHNFHLNIPSDRQWKHQSGINLNSQYAHSQVLGSAVFRKLGVPMADSAGVQLRVNGTNQMSLSLPNLNSYGSYAANEQYNADFVQRSWPLDPEGNSYRGIRDPSASMTGVADLTWHGPDIAQGVYTNAYFKQNNLVQDDWSDLIRLLGVLNVQPGYTTPATYVADVRAVLDVEEWMRYMAVNTLLDNDETCLANGIGDDYALYRGAKDPRFQALPYDLDTVLGRGLTPTPPGHGLFRMTALGTMDRFMKTPEFAPRYFYWLKTLAETAFAPEAMNPLIDQLFVGWVPQPNIDNMKAFNLAQRNAVLSRIPQVLTVQSDLPVQNGYPRSTSGATLLSGSANAIETRSILVNGSPAEYTAWQGRWTNAAVTLHPGINRITVQALGESGREVGVTNILVWYDDGSVQSVSGAVSANTTWTAAGGPYHITANLTVNSGATLTLQPGTTVYLAAGVNLTVASGGRLLAEGTVEAPIHFTRAPTDTGRWGGIVINGGAGTPETRITHAHIEFNGATAIHSSGGTVFLDSLTFGSLDFQYVSLDGSSFIVSHCVFPTPTAAFEPVHGTGGIKAGGHGVVYRCFFGQPNGYNDVVDFTGGNRPGQPIVHFLDNVFIGATDDILDLDGTDAWVEGNIFLHVHKNGAPDSSSAVSGGNTGADTSEVTIINNLFFDCDQAATGKQGNFFTLINNTIVHQSHAGGKDTDGAVVNVADDGTTEGVGMYLEGNIVFDIEKLARNVKAAVVTYTNNILPMEWGGPGGGNVIANPRFRHLPAMSETFFSTWAEAQVLLDWLSLEPGSPAAGTGPNGRDMGGINAIGASISGEPAGTNNAPTATLRVGVNRSGSGIPTSGFPSGSGYVAYRWRLDSGTWSGEVPIQTPISLSALAPGAHQVEVTGRRDTGLYQDDPLLGEVATVSRSKTWVVDPSYVPPPAARVQLSEILAANVTTLTNAGTTPDLIELHNTGTAAADLSGVGLSDSGVAPFKYRFPNGTSLAPGGFLVVYADTATGVAGLHAGFSLKQGGDDVFLTSPTGALLDSASFGVQAADLSIGRGPDGAWVPCIPTPGGPNRAAATGNPAGLRINEWLADAQFIGHNDFIELYNPDSNPVELGGLFLSNASGAPGLHPIAPLSLIAGHGLVRFVADADPGQGPDHLNFKLSPDVGLILLSARDLSLIDGIPYGPQATDVSQGRSPDGSATLTSFTQPTPGGGNPDTSAGGGGCTVLNDVRQLLALDATWSYDQTANLDGVPWTTLAYNDSGWPKGSGLLSVEDCNCLPAPGIGTPLTLGRNTYYFRTKLVVDASLEGFTLNLSTVLDDGAIIYLNGTEWFRLGMPAGAVTYATPAGRNVGNGALEYTNLPPARLLVGTNQLAVEVHQVNGSSSDITFGLSIAASRSVTNCDQTTRLPVVLNEVLASSPTTATLAMSSADWVEIANPSTNLVELAGASLTDDAGFPRKWVFPPGASVPAKGFKVVFFDDTLPASGTNTGFRLPARGGAVYLFDKPANGNALADGITFGLQTAGYAIGRIPSGTGAWTLTVPTPEAVNSEAGTASAGALRVNEWMADPASGSDWFELFNTASQPVAVGGLYLTDNTADRFQSRIAPLSYIGTGAQAYVRFVADNNAAGGADHVNFSLKKGGEAVAIYTAAGTQIDAIAFGSQTTGVSQGRLPDGGPAIVSFPGSASPEASNYTPLPQAVINEVLTHTDPPLEDAIELANPTDIDVPIGGWYLSNSPDDFKRFRIPEGTVLPRHGFAVFYEYQFKAGAGAFTLNSAHGDKVFLSEADSLGSLTGRRSQVAFGAAENGTSFGRVAMSVGADFTRLASRTFGVDAPATLAEFRTGQGLPNSGPKIGPVVISEIHYHPVAGPADPTELAGQEFVEIENATDSVAPLYDPAYPANTWSLRNGVDLEFPPGASLPPRGRMVLVGFSPEDAAALAAFRARYSVPSGTPVVGPWLGRLDNAGEALELVRPDTPQLPPHPDAGYVPQIVVDRVSYGTALPWPAANGNGSSLQRRSVVAYGNDPANWIAAAPTPGDATPGGGETDSDADGLPDSWEIANFGTLARDGKGDFDGDGMTDLQEYLAGTNPTNATDRLRILDVKRDGVTFVIRFAGVAGKSYTLYYRDDVAGGTWKKLADVGTLATTGPVTVTDPGPAPVGNATRFYRVVTPAQ
jgi:hypothetical protein